MRVEKIEGIIKNFWGKPLTELRLKGEGDAQGELNTVAELKFNTAFDAFGPDKNPDSYSDADWDAALEELKAKNEYPTNKDIVIVANNKRKANARQKAMQASVTAAGLVQPTIENDDQLRLKKMYDLFVANKCSHEEAREKAAAALGLVWADAE